MKNIDIQNVQINIDLTKILNLISENIEFEIDIDGKIYPNNSSQKNTPIIFKSKNLSMSKIIDAKSIALDIFKDYKPKVNGAICTLNVLFAWQKIIDLNSSRMLYFDHQSDGVEIFEDKILEDLGWHATAFDITYREISQFIENSCDGVLVFYDNGVQFNGFVLIDDIKDVRLKVKEFLILKINEIFETGQLYINELDDDQEEALEFFNIKL